MNTYWNWFENWNLNSFFKLSFSSYDQLEDRFSDSLMKIVKQLSYFTHESILRINERQIWNENIVELCDFYNSDDEIVSEELNSFSEISSKIRIISFQKL